MVVSPMLMEIVAQVPDTDIYVSPWKLAAIVLVFACWALIAQWVDKDTVAVNTYRVLWNLVFMSVGIVGAAVGLMVPMFLIAFPVYFVMVLVASLVYVQHRNALVTPEDKVLTAEHFRKLREQGFSGKKKKKLVEVKERVRLVAPGKKTVQIPEDEVERERYRLTQDLVFDALWRRANSVELAATGQASKITYSIDGVAMDRDPLERSEADSVIVFFKQICNLNLDEKRKPQQGRMTASVGENRYTIHVKTDGSTAGERLGLRILTGEEKWKIDDLGFNPAQLDLVRQLKTGAEKGLMLLSAPRGQGLTTTLYSFARSHDAFLQNIQIVEYAKEAELDNITQTLYTPNQEKSFSDELIGVLRSDPDIVIVPEIRDRDTAQLVGRYAGDKLRMYSAVNAVDAYDAMRKWIVAVGDRQSAARSLLFITNQRLIRKLCPSCKQAYKPDAAQLKKLNLPAEKVLYREPEPQFDKHGNPIVCQTCQGTNYVGRTGVFEVLPVDDELRALMVKSESAAEFQTYFAKRNAQALQQQALQKVLDGTTSIKEVMRVLRPVTTAAAKPAA